MGEKIGRGDLMTQPQPAPTSAALCSAWATPADLAERDRPELSDAEWEKFLLVASHILWRLTGRQWDGAGCESVATLRAFPPTPGTGTWPYDKTWGRCACWRGAVPVGGWTYPPTSRHAAHMEPVAVRLPGGAVRQVVSVVVDGETLPTTAYRLTRGGYLERLDGRGWSGCDDSTTVTYLRGYPPPADGVESAVQLAIELARAQVGDEGCALPERLTSLTREGISIAVLDRFEFLDKGLTGLYLVDLWVRSVNPQARASRARVWSPDVPRLTR